MKKGNVLTLALAGMLLFGCQSTSSMPVSTTTKVGQGIMTRVDNTGTVYTTYATIGIDSEGKVSYADVDCVEQSATAANPILKTNAEQREQYGMQSTSAAIGNISGGAEWYSQAEAYENYLIGKTEEEIAATPVTYVNEIYTAMPTEGTDLASGCTINIDDFQAAVSKAFANAVEVEGVAKIGATSSISVDPSSPLVDTIVISVALDDSGQIVWMNLDEAQQYTSVENYNTIGLSKYEKQDGYNLRNVSPIKKEWYEQADAYEDYMIGKTLSDVKVRVDGASDAEGLDSISGCTISTGGFDATLLKAIERAK